MVHNQRLIVLRVNVLNLLLTLTASPALQAPAILINRPVSTNWRYSRNLGTRACGPPAAITIGVQTQQAADQGRRG
jgi:hypothetical protein